jgi:hypothetical protein
MKFLLLLITLNAQTGDPIAIEQRGEFKDPAACLQEALDLGPQKVVDGKASVYVCVRDKTVTI